MAEIEERILIARSTDYTIIDTKDGALFEGKIAPHNANVYTPQEVIERMGKAIRKKLFKNEGPTQKIKEEGLEQDYNRYVDFMCECIAESALNALLEE